MKPTRHLALRRETLTNLSDSELSALQGGGTLTLQAGCSVDDVKEWAQNQLHNLTLQPRCSWSCP